MEVIQKDLDAIENRDTRIQPTISPGGLCQSSYWANLLSKVDRAKPIYLEVRDAGEIVALLLLFHHINWDRKRNKQVRDIKTVLSGSYNGWLEWRDGPIFLTHSKQTNISAMKALLGWIDKYCKGHKLARVYGAFSSSSEISTDDELVSLFLNLGYAPNMWATFLVDLQREEEDIWRGLKNSARKSIKKARKFGVEIRQAISEKEVLDTFYLNYQKMEDVAGRSTTPSWVVKKMWDLDDKKYYHYYLAQDTTGEVLAVLGMHVFDGVATEIASSTSQRAFVDKIPAQDLLHWEVLLEAKNRGAKLFDLAGINPHPSIPKEEGIHRFKAKWGGRYAEYNRFEKYYGLSRILRNLRSRFWRPWKL